MRTLLSETICLFQTLESLSSCPTKHKGFGTTKSITSLNLGQKPTQHISALFLYFWSTLTADHLGFYNALSMDKITICSFIISLMSFVINIINTRWGVPAQKTFAAGYFSCTLPSTGTDMTLFSWQATKWCNTKPTKGAAFFWGCWIGCALNINRCVLV